MNSWMPTETISNIVQYNISVISFVKWFKKNPILKSNSLNLEQPDCAMVILHIKTSRIIPAGEFVKTSVSREF